jgi:hypothetical protein
MTKDELLIHLEYCMGDTEIMVKIDGRLLQIQDVNHYAPKESTARFLILIPNERIPRK